MKQGRIWLIPLLAALIVGVYWAKAPENIPVNFNADIRPIINTKCISCHGGVKESSGFSLFSRADALRKTKSGRPAIIPGEADESELIKRILSKDDEERMPYHAEPLSPEEITKMKQWIDQGALWADHWAYIKPQTPALPPDTFGWSINPVDQFIRARLQRENLKPAPVADKATLLRRLSLDLIGLPPTVAEVEAFVADQSEEAYEKQVNRLLASPHFGERWAAMWLDLARYSDTKGYEKDQYRNIWRYRDYVIQSFNQDKPFNQFTVEQLAGDLLPRPTEEQLIATAFHRNTANNDEGGTDDEEFRTTAMLDRVSTTWEVWQGTTMGCVQCHSHPYDPIRHQEFYESMAFFNNTHDEDVPGEYPNLTHFNAEEELKIAQLKDWVQQREPVGAAAQIKTLEAVLRLAEPKIHPHSFDQLTNAALADGKYLGGGHNGYGRLPRVNLTGKATLLLSVGASKAGGILEIRQGSLQGPVIAEYQPENTGGTWSYRRVLVELKPTAGVHDLYFVFRNATLANPQDYVCQLEWMLFLEPMPGKGKPGYARFEKNILTLLNTNAEKTPIFYESPPELRRPNVIFIRGNWLTKGREVQPATPRALPAFTKFPKNRLGLAQWLVSPENPLTARVTVNRFWEQLFGVGLVESLEDFGSQGTKPTHPELLDWLALNFREKQHWQVKKLLKLLVLSNTYRQSSRVTPALIEKDPANHLLARGPRVRLTAEQIRDQALATGGLLSRQLYGKSVMPPQPAGVWQVVYSGMEWKTSPGENAYRRALYTFWRRSSPYPSLLTFDAAGREICVSRRIRTNTPLQALVTLNDTVYLTAARGLAAQMHQASSAPLNQLRYGYYRALFKYPDARTLQVLNKLYRQTESYYQQHPVELQKFLGIKTAAKPASAPQLAALTVVSNAILNLDAYVTKE